MRILFVLCALFYSLSCFALSKPPNLKDYITKDAYILSGTLVSAKLTRNEQLEEGADYKLRINASVGKYYAKSNINFHLSFSDGGMGANKPAVGDDYIFFVYKKEAGFEAAFLMIISVWNLDNESKGAYGVHELLPAVDYFDRSNGLHELVLVDKGDPNESGYFGGTVYEYNDYMSHLQAEYENLGKDNKSH